MRAAHSLRVMGTLRARRVGYGLLTAIIHVFLIIKQLYLTSLLSISLLNGVIAAPHDGLFRLLQAPVMCRYSDGMLEQLTCDTILPQASNGDGLRGTENPEHDFVSIRPTATTSNTDIICERHATETVRF